MYRYYCIYVDSNYSYMRINIYEYRFVYIYIYIYIYMYILISIDIPRIVLILIYFLPDLVYNHVNHNASHIGLQSPVYRNY